MSQAQKPFAKAQSNSSLINAQANPIEYLTFSGGGAKGVCYTGVYCALHESGMMDDIKEIAGSSAGALTAALIATGSNPKKVYKIFESTNLGDLLGDGIPIIQRIAPVLKDGKPLYDLINDKIRSNISDFLQVREIKLDPTDAALLDDLKNRLRDPKGKIYFRDLTLLRKIAPKKFKGLIVTVVEKGSGKLTTFDETTPDVEIALACKASAAFPYILEPVEIDGKKYMDGGYGDNIPVTGFHAPNDAEASEVVGTSAMPKHKGAPLAFAFGGRSNSDVDIAVYSGRKKINNRSRLIGFLRDAMLKLSLRVGGKRYSERTAETMEHIRDIALRTVILDTKDVSTLSFGKAQREAPYLRVKGYCQTMEYLSNHQLGAVYDNFPYQNFLLNVYERTTSKSRFYNILSSEGKKQRKQKMEKLFSYCQEDKLREKDPNQFLREYLGIAAMDHKGRVHVDTKTVESLLEALNSKSTGTNMMKSTFIEILGINRDKDKRLSDKKGKTKGQILSEFKFTKADVKKYIKRSMSLSTESLNSRNTSSLVSSSATSRKVSFVQREEAKRELSTTTIRRER